MRLLILSYHPREKMQGRKEKDWPFSWQKKEMYWKYWTSLSNCGIIFAVDLKPDIRQVTGLGRYAKKNSKKSWQAFRLLRNIATVCAAVLCIVYTVQLLEPVVTGSGFTAASGTGGSSNAIIMDRYDTYINNALSDALEGLEGIERPKKNYWLSDEDLIAPAPDPGRWGSTDDPASLQEVLDRAERLLGEMDLIFSTDIELYGNSKVTYYLDETIFAITWQQVIDSAVYSFSEVKIAHASQFRRFLADGTYGSDRLYYPTEMAATVNAVTASSGDFYKFRAMGVIVYNGQVQRVNSQVDTCYIDENGDFLFTGIGEINTMEQAEQFVEDNNIRFSLAFGPTLVVDGENVAPSSYLLGEGYKKYSRAAIAQVDELHYLMMTVNLGPAEGYRNTLTIEELAAFMTDLGVRHAYALDGGQTGTIIANDTLVNRPDYGTQRKISDIIYFATAVPEEE